jgi:Protein of unknown function (DUF2635)
MANVFVKPINKDGKAVRVPDMANKGRPLAAGGEWKPLNQYWQRRIDQRDVIDATNEQLAVQAASSAAAAPVEPQPAAAPSSKSSGSKTDK